MDVRRRLRGEYLLRRRAHVSGCAVLSVVTLAAVNARPDPIAVLDGVGATLVPDSDCLRTEDGDTSYAVFVLHGASSFGINADNSVLWTAAPAPTGVHVTRAEMVVQVRYDIGADGFDSLQMGWSNADGSAFGVVWPGFGAQPFITSTYAEYRGDIDPVALIAAAGADLSGAIFYAGFAGGRSSDTMRVTYAAVVLTVKNVAPLRQFPRDDGLVGTSAARQASTATSRQASVRQSGYL